MKTYISQVCAGPKSKIPKNHSFVSLQGHVNYPFIKAKLQFLVTDAKILCPFLESFQSERPMLPFMAEYIQNILHTILERHIKKSVMDKTTSVFKLAKVDVNEKESLLPTKNVLIGFAIRKIISNIWAK